MSGPVYYNSDNTPINCLTQWDRDLILVVSGAETSPTPVFHFSNKKSKMSLPVTPTVSNSKLSVKIPNILLQDALPIIVDIYYRFSDGSARNKYTTIIPVIPKARPSGYEYVEVDTPVNAVEEIVISDYMPGGTAKLWIDTSDIA